MATQRFTVQDCERRNNTDDEESSYWVIIEGYVVDLTTFLPHHPGSKRCDVIDQKRRQLGPDITRNFIDHFGHTVQTFRQACQTYERTQQPVTVQFQERPHSNVVILGKVVGK